MKDCLTRFARKYGGVAILIMLVVSIGAAAVPNAPTPPLASSSEAPQVSIPRFQSAQECRSCHTTIYDEWRQSWMARAYTNRLFQLQYEAWKAYSKNRSDLDPLSCLRCHAPLAALTNDKHAKTPLSREGVSCDVCHTVAAVKTQGSNKSLVFDPSGTKYTGNNKSTANAFHKTANSEAIRSAEVCAGCHLDLDAKGMPLEATFDEWRDSSYAEQGVRCQECHMRPKRKGRSSGADGSNSAARFSHRFEGGHSTSSLLKRAASVKILLDSKNTQFHVEVTNRTVGHNFPTKGAHPNELILTILAKDQTGAEVYQDQRVYAVVNLNSAGKPAGDTEPVASVEDTTLRPLEARIESFDLPTRGRIKKIEATLRYHLIPAWLGKQLDPAEYHQHYRPTVIDRAYTSFSR